MASPDGLYALSIHDVAPVTWRACEELLVLADAVAAPCSLLVVPHYHGGVAIADDPGFLAALRARVAKGDDVLLHGFRHIDDGPAPRGPVAWVRRRVYTAGEGEFEALDAGEAARRIAAGRATLDAAGLATDGFVAPAWLMGPGCRDALRTCGLSFASERNALLELPAGRTTPAPSLVFSTRSAPRRVASRLVNRARLVLHRSAPLIRAALHPADAGHRDVMASWASLLHRLAATRRAVLERDALGLQRRAATR